jgi:hypothetical protein
MHHVLAGCLYSWAVALVWYTYTSSGGVTLRQVCPLGRPARLRIMNTCAYRPHKEEKEPAVSRLLRCLVGAPPCSGL